MAMEAVWMSRATHMKGRKLPIMATTSALFVNSAGKNTTTSPAHNPQACCQREQVSNTGPDLILRSLALLTRHTFALATVPKKRYYEEVHDTKDGR